MELFKAGVVYTFPKICKVLEEVKILFIWDELKGQKLIFEIIDGFHNTYFKKEIKSGTKKAEIKIKAGRFPGVHYIKVQTVSKNNKKYIRYGSFRVVAFTEIFVDDERINSLFKYLEEGIKLSIDLMKVNGQLITAYKVGDNSWENIAYPIYGISSMRYFVNDTKSMIEVLYKNQWKNGKLPDHIYGDTHLYYLKHKIRKLRTLMADIETASIYTVYKSWESHGDDEWLKKLIPKMEKGIFYITKNPMIFDKKFNLIKRPHTCDMWDVQILDNSNFITKNSKFVLMQGDTSSLFQACDILYRIHKLFGDKKKAEYWKKQKEYYYIKGNKLFWDGKKYKHHIHLDEIDHKEFKEEEQLAMSNVLAITRGFANKEKAISIINEYIQRAKKTKTLPWWSLQPGYPDNLGYFNTEGLWSRKQGEYCNGGLFPLVGGELCKSLFEYGKEKIGFKLLLDFYYVIKKNYGAVFTWYNLKGFPSINAPHHQTNYDLWGITPWFESLIEEFFGIKTIDKTFNKVLCCPRLTSSKIKNGKVIAYFPSSNTYFAYNWFFSKNRIEIDFTGTGKKVIFKILIPENKDCKKVLLDSKNKKFKVEKILFSNYIKFESNLSGVHKIIIELKDKK